MAPRQLSVPDINSLDPDEVIVRYDEPSDTMFVHFFGTGQPGVSVQVEEDIYLRLDRDEQRVIGIQIDAFLRSATLRRPELLTLAQFAEIPNHLLRQWIRRKETNSARLGFIDSVVHEWMNTVET